MRRFIPLIAAAALSACGADVASSAATAASLKKQELEQGKKSMDQFQQKLGTAMEQTQEAAQNRENAADKQQ